MGGGYVCFGVFEVYNDNSLNILFSKFNEFINYLNINIIKVIYKIIIY